MKRKIKTLFTSLLVAFPMNNTFSQSGWSAPDEEREKISIHRFEDDFVNEGNLIFNRSCKSCHGKPGEYLSPVTGDITESRFQLQQDGGLFYKIRTGKGGMPKFEDILTEEEIWNVIAYIRSFNKEYVQPVPDLTGIEIPVIYLKAEFDDNIDKLVIKAANDKGKALKEVSVAAFIKSMFGKLKLGKSTTNEFGIAYFDVDPKIPGDSLGRLNILVKASMGYGSAGIDTSLVMVEPKIYKSAIEGRHLWSTSKNAPIWLKSIFLLTLAGIWGTIFYIIIGLKNIRKFK